MPVNDSAVAPRPGPNAREKVSRGPGRPSLSNEELLNKALDLFLENGFERTTIDAITASAGMAKRTVYLRYGDKTTLFKAALQQAIDEWIVPVERLRAVETDDLEETLLRVGQTLVANLMRPEGLRLLRITNAESGRMPEIGAYTYQHGTAPTIAYLADLFRRRIALPPGLADPEEAAVAFLYLVVCGPPTMTAWGMVLDDAAVDRHTRFCVALFLHGALPRDGTTAPSRSIELGSELEESERAPRGMPESHQISELETENRRLKKLLLESMLEVAALKEQQAKGSV